MSKNQVLETKRLSQCNGMSVPNLVNVAVTVSTSMTELG